MLLPAPGGPTISKLCPPAAATSRARRAPGCPRTSDRQGTGAASGQGLGTASGSRQMPEAWAATSARLRADNTRKPGTQAACSALPAGRINVAWGALARNAQRDHQRRGDGHEGSGQRQFAGQDQFG